MIVIQTTYRGSVFRIHATADQVSVCRAKVQILAWWRVGPVRIGKQEAEDLLDQLEREVERYAGVEV